jgi:hypothetical protein
MLSHFALLAQAGDPSELIKAADASEQKSPFLQFDTLLILGAVVAVAAILFLCAYLFHRRTMETAGELMVSQYNGPEGSASGERSGKRVRKRRRRVNHSDNLPRNPTLAETGGLPPPRPEEASPEPPSSNPIRPSTHSQPQSR